MAQLKTKVLKYLEANSKTWEAEANNIILQDDRIAGVVAPYIKTWNVSGGLAKPTAEQLETYDASAIIEENNQQAISNRQKEYGNNTTQIENIIENGLEAEQARVQTIKDKYPKE
jgi:hypothetical protein|tara:strand:- start:1267 stop:1611 length:345 start_codon:yes stop_codon:yes gene_type:complete